LKKQASSDKTDTAERMEMEKEKRRARILKSAGERATRFFWRYAKQGVAGPVSSRPATQNLRRHLPTIFFLDS
jgi:hypothetical protein